MERAPSAEKLRDVTPLTNVHSRSPTVDLSSSILDNTTHTNQGNLNAVITEAPKTVKQLKEILKVQKKTLGKYSIQAIKTINELGEAYYRAQNFGEAIKHHKKALECWKEAHKSSAENFDFKEVEASRYEHAVIQMPPKKRLVFAKALKDMGHIMRELEEHDRALKYYQSALGIYEGNCHRLDPRIEKYNLNVANTFKRLGCYDEMIEHVDRALACGWERDLNKGNRYFAIKQYSKTAYEFGRSLIKLGLYKKSIEYFNRVYEYEQERHQKHPLIASRAADSLHGIGCAYEELGKHENAIDHYENAFALYNENVQRLTKSIRHCHDSHVRSRLRPKLEHEYFGGVDCCYNIALISQHLGHTEEAIAKYDESIALIEASHVYFHKTCVRKMRQHQHHKVADHIGKIARALAKGKHYEAALDYARRALNVSECTYGNAHLRTAGFCDHLAQILVNHLGRDEEAVKYAEQSLTTMKDCHSHLMLTGDSPKKFGCQGYHDAIAGAANSLRTLGIIHNNLGNVEKSVECLKEAIDTARKVYKENSKILRDYGDLLKKVTKKLPLEKPASDKAPAVESDGRANQYNEIPASLSALPTLELGSITDTVSGLDTDIEFMNRYQEIPPLAHHANLSVRGRPIRSVYAELDGNPAREDGYAALPPPTPRSRYAEAPTLKQRKGKKKITNDD